MTASATPENYTTLTDATQASTDIHLIEADPPGPLKPRTGRVELLTDGVFALSAMSRRSRFCRSRVVEEAYSRWPVA
jgi:hypothetical protein